MSVNYHISVVIYMHIGARLKWHLLFIVSCVFMWQMTEAGYECLVHLTSPAVRIPALRLDQNTVVCDTFQVICFAYVLLMLQSLHPIEVVGITVEKNVM